MLTQLRHAGGYSSHSENAIAFLVPVLFQLRGPSTIIRFIVAVFRWVSIDLFSFRTFPHIFQKTFKGFPPTLAHCYSNAAVAIKGVVFGIGTTLNHIRPRQISSGKTSLGCVSMRGAGFFQSLDSETPTRLGVPRTQSIIESDKEFSAIALEKTFSSQTAIGMSVRFGFSNDYSPSIAGSNRARFYMHNGYQPTVFASSGVRRDESNVAAILSNKHKSVK